MKLQGHKTEGVDRTKTRRIPPFVFKRNAPRKGKRIPRRKYNEQQPSSIVRQARDLFHQSLGSIQARRPLAAPEIHREKHLEDAVFGRMADHIHVPENLEAHVEIRNRDFLQSMRDLVADAPEPDVYFYHSDHLGSASWITDANGEAVQHLQYLPYGEPYINQRNNYNAYNERFTFAGKERDEETGYGYFGARYMDYDLMTMWLSVDPLADKYPSISPYAYCVWNPMKLIDPDGREIDDYKLNTKTGSLILTRKTSDNFDMIVPDNESIEAKIVSKGILNGEKVGDDVSKTGFAATGGKQAEGVAVMVYISFSSHRELSAWGYNDNKGKSCLDVAPWDKNTSSKSWSDFTSGKYDNKGTRSFHVHTHPGTENGKGGRAEPSSTDAIRAKNFISNYYIISRNQGLSQYNSTGKYWEPLQDNTPTSLLPYRIRK